MRVSLLLASLVAAALSPSLPGGEFPRTLKAHIGKTPKLDGILAPGEYADATKFSGVGDWIPQFTPTRDPKDLALA